MRCCIRSQRRPRCLAPGSHLLGVCLGGVGGARTAADVWRSHRRCTRSCPSPPPRLPAQASQGPQGQAHTRTSSRVLASPTGRRHSQSTMRRLRRCRTRVATSRAATRVPGFPRGDQGEHAREAHAPGRTSASAQSEGGSQLFVLLRPINSATSRGLPSTTYARGASAGAKSDAAIKRHGLNSPTLRFPGR